MMAPTSTSFIATMSSSSIPPATSSLIIGKGQEGRFFPLFALPLMVKVLGKGAKRAGRRYNNTDKTF